MIKLIGSLLVIISSALAGIYFSNLDDYRADDLRDFKKALEILRSEIRFASVPLPEAVLSIADRVNAPVSTIFSTFASTLSAGSAGSAYDAWVGALREHLRITYLKPEDIECFDSFGKTLGYLDKGMQLESIDRAVEYIDAATERLSVNGIKSKKMYRSLGVLGGLLIVVIFIGR